MLMVPLTSTVVEHDAHLTHTHTHTHKRARTHTYTQHTQHLRRVFDIAQLKDELREDLHDTLAVTESDWVEERRGHQQRERFWKVGW